MGNQNFAWGGNDPDTVTLPGDVPRRLVTEDTRENRESWFVVFDGKRYESLIRSRPTVGPEPTPPAAFEEDPVESDKSLLTIFWLTGIIGVLGFFADAIFLLMLLPAALVWKRSTGTGAKQHALRTKLLAVGLAVTSVFLAVAAMIEPERSHGVGPWTLLLRFSFVVTIITSGGLIWRQFEKVAVAEGENVARRALYNNLLARYKQELRDRERNITDRARIETEISEMERKCLHPRLMAQDRLRLMNELFEQAAAVLNVEPAEAMEVFNAPGERFLEIIYPNVNPPQRYERPVVNVSIGLGAVTERDTPATRDLLAHTYHAITAMVLRQGVGIVASLIDSVDQTVTVVGHDLMLWKTISRVSRQQSELGDEIVLETFGGSRPFLPVNGALTQEFVATLPRVQFGEQEQPADTLGSPTVREVNAFIREVQGRVLAAQ